MKEIDKLASAIRSLVKSNEEDFGLFKDEISFGNRFEKKGNLYTYVYQRGMRDSWRSIYLINYQTLNADRIIDYLENIFKVVKKSFKEKIEGRIYIGDTSQIAHHSLNHDAYEIRFNCFGNGTELFIWEK